MTLSSRTRGLSIPDPHRRVTRSLAKVIPPPYGPRKDVSSGNAPGQAPRRSSRIPTCTQISTQGVTPASSCEAHITHVFSEHRSDGRILTAARPKRHASKKVATNNSSLSEPTSTCRELLPVAPGSRPREPPQRPAKRRHPDENDTQMPNTKLDSLKSSRTGSPPESEDSDMVSEDEAVDRPAKRRRTMKVAPNPPVPVATPVHFEGGIRTSRASGPTLLPPTAPPSPSLDSETERNSRIHINVESFEREVLRLPSSLGAAVRHISGRIAVSSEWKEMVDDYRFSLWSRPGAWRSGDPELLLMDLFNLARVKAAGLGLSSSFVTPIWYGRRETEDAGSRPKRRPRSKYPGVRVPAQFPDPLDRNPNGQQRCFYVSEHPLTFFLFLRCSTSSLCRSSATQRREPVLPMGQFRNCIGHLSLRQAPLQSSSVAHFFLQKKTSRRSELYEFSPVSEAKENVGRPLICTRYSARSRCSVVHRYFSIPICASLRYLCAHSYTKGR